MRSSVARTFTLTAVALALATSVEAQGHKKDRGDRYDRRDVYRDRGRDRDRDRDVYRRDGAIIRGRDGDLYRVQRIPPGLAKKPGGMPPGQYKKRYGAHQGANVLSNVMRQRGYRVVRVVPSGNSRYVYYRYRDGREQRAWIRPGTDRLMFSNVPPSILQAVMAQLY